jgi:ubiquinone/menaquinone biosynthesis C-methylase UbiE
MDPNAEHARLNERKWDARAVTYDKKRFDYFRWMQRRVIQLVDLRPGLHFLDIGCGTGWAVRYVAHLLQGQGQFHGIDLSSQMIEVATAKDLGFKNVRFFRANAEHLPFESSSVDCAICTNSFHHYRGPERMLAEVRRVLKPGGRLYILDVTTDDPFMRWIDGRVRMRQPEHVKMYSSREFQAMFAAAKLDYLKTSLVAYPVKIHVAGRG